MSALPPYEPTPMTAAQEAALQEINDAWPVARWIGTPDGNVLVVCDDGDEALIQPSGAWRWVNR